MRELARLTGRFIGFHLTGLLPKHQAVLFVFGPKASFGEIITMVGLLSKMEISTRIVLPKANHGLMERLILTLFGIQFLQSRSASQLSIEMSSLVERNAGRHVAFPIELIERVGLPGENTLDGRQFIPLGIDRKKRRLKLHASFMQSGSAARDLRFLKDTLEVYANKHT